MENIMKKHENNSKNVKKKEKAIQKNDKIVAKIRGNLPKMRRCFIIQSTATLSVSNFVIVPVPEV